MIEFVSDEMKRIKDEYKKQGALKEKFKILNFISKYSNGLNEDALLEIIISYCKGIKELVVNKPLILKKKKAKA